MKKINLFIFVCATTLFACIAFFNCFTCSNVHAAEPEKREIPPVAQVPHGPFDLRIESITEVSTCPQFPYIYWWEEDQTCRSIPYPTDWSGPNLFNPNNWQITYGDRDTCNLVLDGNRYMEMTKTSTGWPPCGVMQKLYNPVEGQDYRGMKFRIVADVIENTDQSEVYTGADDSLFKPGTGTRTDVLTSAWADMVVWLQTYTSDENKLPITTKWRNVVIKRIE